MPGHTLGNEGGDPSEWQNVQPCGRGTLAIVTDADLLFRIAGLSSLLLLGVFSTHEASRVVGRIVE